MSCPRPRQLFRIDFYATERESVTCEEQTLLIICNKSDDEVAVELPAEVTGKKWQRILTNREASTPSLDGGRKWLPWEAEIYTMV